MTEISTVLSIHQTIRSRIIALDADIDEVTLADTLEGLSDLNEIVAAVVRGALFDEALAAGLKAHIVVLQNRHARIARRAEARRQLARDAMIEAGLKKIAAPDFTLSVRPGSPSLIVTAEADVPAAYWRPRDPVLDRAGLMADLKAGAPIPGVALSSPEPVLSVRVR